MVWCFKFCVPRNATNWVRIVAVVGYGVWVERRQKLTYRRWAVL